MNKKMFELNLFENTKVKDILDTPIEEGAQEFEAKSPASPTEHIDNDCSGEKDVAKKPTETPTAKPADGEMGPVNANTQAEAPTAKPYDANSISIPGKATLTVDQYNQAISQLQKSFKEGAELLAALQQVEVVQEEALTDEELAAMNTVLEMCIEKPDQMKKWASNELFYMASFTEAYELFEEASREAALYPDFKNDTKELSRIIAKIVPSETDHLRIIWNDLFRDIGYADAYAGYHQKEIENKRFNQAQLDYAGKNSKESIENARDDSKGAKVYLMEWRKLIQKFKNNILKLLPKNTPDNVKNIAKAKVLLNKICTAMMSPGLTKNDLNTLKKSFDCNTLEKNFQR